MKVFEIDLLFRLFDTVHVSLEYCRIQEMVFRAVFRKKEDMTKRNPGKALPDSLDFFFQRRKMEASSRQKQGIDIFFPY